VDFSASPRLQGVDGAAMALRDERLPRVMLFHVGLEEDAEQSKSRDALFSRQGTEPHSAIAVTYLVTLLSHVGDWTLAINLTAFP
jgi:hypothetical protein